MKVTVIYEEDHGLLAIAKDYVAAIKWLVESGWMTQHSEIYDYNTLKFYKFKDWFGDGWLGRILGMTLAQFNELETNFCLKEEEVYCAS